MKKEIREISLLRLGLPSVLLPSRFPSKILYAFLTSHMRCMPPRPSHRPWFDHPNNIWWKVQIMELLIMKLFLVSSYIILLRSKYSSFSRALFLSSFLYLSFSAFFPYLLYLILCLFILILLFPSFLPSFLTVYFCPCLFLEPVASIFIVELKSRR
jgi:hypothetical protein